MPTSAAPSPSEKEKQHAYTSKEIDTLLHRYLDGNDDIAVSDFVFLEKKEEMQRIFKLAAKRVRDGAHEAVAVPIHVYGPEHPHWTMGLFRKRANGRVQFLYNDSGFGNGQKSDHNPSLERHSLRGHPNGDAAIAAIREIDSDADIVDMQHRQQNGGEECGAFVTQNLVTLAQMATGDYRDRDLLDDLGDGKIGSEQILYSPTNYHGKKTFSGSDLRSRDAKENPDLPLDEEVTRHVNKIIEKNDLLTKGLYPRKVVEAIKGGLYRNIITKGGVDNAEAKQFVAQLESVFAKRSELIDDLRRVTAKQEAINKFKQEGVKASAVMEAAMKKAQRSDDRVSYLAAKQAASQIDGGHLNSGDPKDLAIVRKDESVPVHVTDPSEYYKFLVAEAKHSTQLDLIASDKTLEIMLDQGRMPTPEEEAVIDNPESSMQHYARFLAHMAKAAKARSPFATDEEKLETSSRRRDLINSRNAMLASAAASLGFNGEQMKRIKDRIANEVSGDTLFDYTAFEMIRKIIDEEAKKMDDGQKKLKDEFDKKIKGIEGEIKKEEEKFLGLDKDLLQGRLLMLFLGLTPFGLFANVLGGIFNYPEVLSGIFESVFSNASIPDKIADAITGFNPAGIPIGEALEEMHVGDLIRSIKDAPIIGQLLELPDVFLDNEIVQTGAPLLNTILFKNDLLPFVVAGWYGYCHMGKEIDVASQESTYMESIEKKHRDAVKNFSEDYEKVSLDRVKSLAKERLAGMKTAYRVIKFCEYAATADEETLKTVFGDAKITLSDKSEATLAELKKGGKLNDPLNISALLEKNAAVRGGIVSKFLAFAQADHDVEKYQAVMKNFAAESDKFAKQKAELEEKKTAQNATEAAATDDKIKKIDEKIEELHKVTFAKQEEKFDCECLDKLAEIYSIKSIFKGAQRAAEINYAVLWRYEEELRDMYHGAQGAIPSTKVAEPTAAKVKQHEELRSRS
jgi:hypothetical protein